MAVNEAGTLRALWLGQQLRELREGAGRSQEEAGEYLGKHPSTIGRYENAFIPINWPEVDALLRLYGVSDADLRENLLQLAKDAWRKGWWEEFGDVVRNDRFLDHVWLESRALTLRSYNMGFVPGLLQTRSYMDTLFSSNSMFTAEQAERALALRMERQKLLKHPTHPSMTVILEESLLHRPLGGPDVLREQLTHILTVGNYPDITIRILPLSAGVRRALSGDFMVFELGAPMPPVAYVENHAGCLYVESPKSERFLTAYDDIEGAALSPEESATVIERAIEELV